MNTGAARESWVGQIVDGKYPLVKWLGGSERSAVFATRLPGKEQQAAAIKLVSPEPGTAERQVGQWKAAGELAHPHLLKLLAAGQCEIGGTPQLYAVMEYAEEDLSQVLPARALSTLEVRDMLPPLLEALAYLHEKRLLHGRVKPSNIMAVGSQLKLSTDSVHGLNEVGAEGRPRSAFDAPEVGKGGATRASDIWSVGVTLMRCLSQRAQVRESYDPIQHGVTQAIPEPFRRIARECLRPDPKSRCTIADIRTWLQPAALASTGTKQAEPQRAALPSMSVIATVAVIVLLGAAFVVKWVTGGKTEAPVQSAQEQTAPHSSQQQTASAPAATKPAAAAPQVSTPAQVPPSSQASPPPEVASTKPSPTADSGAASAPAQAPVATPIAKTSTSPSVPVPVYSTPGEVIEKVVPDVPVGARNTITGKVRVSVRVSVNAAGGIADATLAAPGPSKYFARMALEASRDWKFKPAQAGGHAVASAWMLRYEFGRDGVEAFPTELAGTQ
jgi:TonB family protein